MSIVEYIRELLFVDTNDQNQNKNASGDSRGIWEQKSIKQIEENLADAHHTRRINLVTDQLIPTPVWISFANYIRNEKKNKWGIDRPENYIRKSEEGMLCTYHDDDIPMVERVVSKLNGNRLAQTENISSTIRGKAGIGTIGSISSSVGSSSAEKIEESDEFKIESSIIECVTDMPDCKSNRRAFISMGKECMVNGTSGSEILESVFEQKCKQSGTHTNEESEANSD